MTIQTPSNLLFPIHIVWRGPIQYRDAISRESAPQHGLYQFYGNHIVYGSDTLLYVGKALLQSFDERLTQHNFDQWDAGKTHVVLGEIVSKEKLPDEVWKKQVDLAEALLIYAHGPAWNSSNVSSIDYPRYTGVHIYNWGRRHKLLPEVSYERWCGVGNSQPRDLRLQSEF